MTLFPRFEAWSMRNAAILVTLYYLTFSGGLIFCIHRVVELERRVAALEECE